MNNPRVVLREQQKRFVSRGGVVIALIFMLAFATIQIQVNGVRGLADGKFVGVFLLVGFFAFRTGRWVALGLYALTRAIGQRGGPKA